MDLSNLSCDLPPSKPVTQANLGNLFNDLTIEFKNAAKSVASLYSLTVSGGVRKESLTGEFASAAKSVASLYRLANTCGSLQQHKGYLQCLDDLLDVISHDGDIENWALTKRAELTYEKKLEQKDNDRPERAQEGKINRQHVHVTAEEEVDENGVSGDGIGETTQTTPTNHESTAEQLHQLIDKLDGQMENEANLDFTFDHDLKPYKKFVPSLPLLSVQHSPKALEKFKKAKIMKKLLDEPSLDSEHDEEPDKVLKKRKMAQADSF